MFSVARRAAWWLGARSPRCETQGPGTVGPRGVRFLLHCEWNPAEGVQVKLEWSEQHSLCVLEKIMMATGQEERDSRRVEAGRLCWDVGCVAVGWVAVLPCLNFPSFSLSL